MRLYQFRRARRNEAGLCYNHWRRMGMNVKLPSGVAPILKSVYDESRRRRIMLFGVGGCVRDWLLGLESKDLDLVSEEDPLPVARWCARRWGGRIEVFERFLTARVFVAPGGQSSLRRHSRLAVLPKGGFRIDFARAREESYPEPAALPVVRPGTLERDLIRRDFAINAMAAALVPGGFGEILDPYHGRDDLRRKTLCMLHGQSFRDDPTRMHRAARFACRFGFRLDPQTEDHRRQAVKAGWAKLLSRERLRGELVRVLEEKHPTCALKKLKSWGLNGLFHPKLTWPAKLAQGGSVRQRLGMMALHMNSPEGEDFLESLHLERPVSQALIEALHLAREKAAPRAKIAPLTREVLRLSLKNVAESAFDPLCIGGRDLEALGLRPGPDYKTWLGRAAEAQWAGEFSTRPEALRWLKARLSRARA